MTDKPPIVCDSCGWVHFGVSREYAQAEVEAFNRYYDTLTTEQRATYYGNTRPEAYDYDHCFCCHASWTKGRPWRDGDKILMGHTTQPIIMEDGNGE